MDMETGWEMRLDEFARLIAERLKGSGWFGSLASLLGYLLGLLLPGERKSMEPIAERLDPQHTEAKHAAIQWFITDTAWDQQLVLRTSREYGLPAVLTKGPLEAWIVDDTAFPKQGTHSVGVAHQYCGQLGKTANCQAAVSISLANHFAGLPVAYRLYLPKEWTDDPARCKAVGVPPEVAFKKKWEIALDLVDGLLREGVPKAPFLGDAAYGDIWEFRDGLTSRGFSYALGIRGNNTIWPPGWTPLPPAPKKPGRGRPASSLKGNPECPAVRVDEFALTLPPEAWHEETWREGTRGPMTSRFAAVRVRSAHARTGAKAIQIIPEEGWLLVEWPSEAPEPTHYWLSTLSAMMPVPQIVDLAKLRWRIEQDYEELKQEVGLGDFEGRTWRGFHHHGSLCIAAYTFLIAEQARLSPPNLRSALRAAGFQEPPVPGRPPWRKSPTSHRTP
jgi:SRSO17 transposase